MKTLKVYLILSLLALGCTPAPKPIDYGSDDCHYCKMTIMDPQHAAELVTRKGKVFKFDAIECMTDYLNTSDLSDFVHILVHDYFEPTEWLSADTCTYLISEAIPSPMGAFLSAISTIEKARELQESKGGHLYNWNELKNHLATE